jgi:hypothetical protein
MNIVKLSSLTKSPVNAVPGGASVLSPTLLQVGTGTVLTVGAGMEFATLGDACKAAASGDTIAVRAGTYVNDFATVTTNLRIVAVGGIVNEVATEPPPNDKALITVDANMSIQGFTFTGGSDGSPDGNVSGIRLEAGNLSVNYCYFHDMQEGLLAGADPTAVVTIDHSEFARNGTGDGYTHNLYVGAVASLTIANSYFHDANVGHEIKSRAAVTTIVNNVIADGPAGTASYDIDLPNAGVARIANNLIEKGPNASNYYAIHYGGETQFAWANNSLSITNNTILNDLGPNGVAVYNQSAVNGLSVSAAISGNRFWGFDTARLVFGAGTMRSNAILTSRPSYTTPSPWTAAPILGLSPGPQLLTLTNSGHAISGGQACLTVQDTGGSNTISGGSGGVAVTATAGWDLITTQTGAADAVVLSGRNSVLHSYGNDHIAAPGTYEEVDAFGQSTITGSGFSTYNLNGIHESLTSASSALVNVGAAAAVQVTDLSGDLQLSLAAGGQATITDLAATPGGGAASAATVSGGAATAFIGNGGVISITTSDGGASIVAGGGGVDVTGGNGADSLVSGSGTDNFTLGAGADSVTFGSGSATVTGGAGADTYAFKQGQGGTDTITDFKQGTDILQFNGFAGAAIASGTIAGGSTLLTLTDGTTIDLVSVVLPGYASSGSSCGGGGGGASPVPPPPTAGTGTISLTSGGHVISGGADAMTVLDYAGGNTVAGGVGGLSAVAGDSDVLSTQAAATDQLMLSRYDSLTACGADTVTVTGYANNLTFSNTGSVALFGAGNAVSAGAGFVAVWDQVGGDTITGGAGGVAAMLAGTYDSVSTAVGAADTISLAGQDTVLSQGADKISAAGNYNQVTATGAAGITAAAGFSTYVLDGADSLSGAGGGVVTVGSAANVTIASAGQQDLSITKLAGGILSVSESLAGGLSALSVTGGAATISAAAGQYAGLRATVGSGVTVTAAAGNVTLTGGAGQDSFAGGSGQALITLGNQDTVSLGAGAVTVQGGTADAFVVPQDATGTLVVMNWSAQDSIVTPGQAAPAISSQTVSGGNTWITMVGGAHIELVGVTHTG